MNYTETDVLNIIKSVSDKNPEKALHDWLVEQSNIPVTGDIYDGIFSIPIIFKGRRIATMTLLNIGDYGDTIYRNKLMQKYLGVENHDGSYYAFSHDTYKFCYLTVHEEFKLPQLVKDFHVLESVFTLETGEEIKWRILYGFPSKEKDEHVFHQYMNDRNYNTYRVMYDDVNMQIENTNIPFKSIKESINEKIKERTEKK